MDSNPYRHTSKFVELLNSQQDTVFGLVQDNDELFSSQVPVFGTQGTEDSNFGKDTPAEHRERRKWTPIDDVVIISSWLNTSKDPDVFLLLVIDYGYSLFYVCVSCLVIDDINAFLF